MVDIDNARYKGFQEAYDNFIKNPNAKPPTKYIKYKSNYIIDAEKVSFLWWFFIYSERS